jgi:hypothetical protein
MGAGAKAVADATVAATRMAESFILIYLFDLIEKEVTRESDMAEARKKKGSRLPAMHFTAVEYQRYARRDPLFFKRISFDPIGVTTVESYIFFVGRWLPTSLSKKGESSRISTEQGHTSLG